MKKVIVILLMSISGSACKEGNKEKNELVSTGTERKAELGIADIPNCNGPLVVINKDVFTATELAQWEVENSKYYCTMVLSAADSKTCGNYGVMDLSLISDKTKIVAEWLSDNTDYLCYPASYPLIEKDHVVTDLNIIKDIDQSITTSKNLHMTLKAFVSKVANFDVFNYERYINFSIDATTNIPVAEPGNKFDGNLYSFSVPSIKAIAARYKIDTKDFDKFDVDLVKVFDPVAKKVTIGFRISHGTIALGYYDYSTDPSGTPPHTLRSSNNFR